MSIFKFCNFYVPLQVEEVVDPFPKDVFHKARLAVDGCTGDVLMLVYETVSVLQSDCWYNA